MYVYVVHDVEGGFDFPETISPTKHGCATLFNCIAPRCLIHPMHTLRIRHLTGWTHARLNEHRNALRAARAEVDRGQ